MEEDHRRETGQRIGVKNAPADFLNWAMQNGAVSKEADTEWQALLTRE